MVMFCCSSFIFFSLFILPYYGTFCLSKMPPDMQISHTNSVLRVVFSLQNHPKNLDLCSKNFFPL